MVVGGTQKNNQSLEAERAHARCWCAAQHRGTGPSGRSHRGRAVSDRQGKGPQGVLPEAPAWQVCALRCCRCSSTAPAVGVTAAAVGERPSQGCACCRFSTGGWRLGPQGCRSLADITKSRSLGRGSPGPGSSSTRNRSLSHGSPPPAQNPPAPAPGGTASSRLP